MLSYWLDHERKFNDVPDLLAALADRGVDLWIEQKQDVWVINVLDRPKWVYDSLASLEKAGQSKTAAKHIQSLWFVLAGDQFIFTTEAEEELRPFLAGMLAMYLMEAGPPPIP